MLQVRFISVFEQSKEPTKSQLVKMLNIKKASTTQRATMWQQPACLTDSWAPLLQAMLVRKVWFGKGRKKGEEKEEDEEEKEWDEEEKE